jgi:Predicted acetyltransferase
MNSFICDNGIESELNRGTFYGYRNAAGHLEGVALIGHTTLLETRTDEALKAFAFVARAIDASMHLVMSGGNTAESFWNHYSGNQAPRVTCTELLFEVAFPYPVMECEWNVRPAAMAELEEIAEAQAAIAVMESDVDPMERDREGFLKRVARRIGQGRVFVVYENGKLLFKADIVAETDQVIYLEGIYVAPEYRGQGVGSKCLSSLTLHLLRRAKTICMLSNINYIDAHLSYLKAGYKNTDSCTTLFA